jgi:hypothetical protein
VVESVAEVSPAVAGVPPLGSVALAWPVVGRGSVSPASPPLLLPPSVRPPLASLADIDAVAREPSSLHAATNRQEPPRINAVFNFMTDLARRQ